jgi:hypothetical protein
MFLFTLVRNLRSGGHVAKVPVCTRAHIAGIGVMVIMDVVVLGGGMFFSERMRSVSPLELTAGALVLLAAALVVILTPLPAVPRADDKDKRT